MPRRHGPDNTTKERTLETLIARITAIHHCKPSRYSPAGVNFTIASTDVGIAVVGEMSRPVVGQQYNFDGEYEFSQKYGKNQFKFERFEAVIDRSVSGIATFLAAHIDGLGPVKAERLVESLGLDAVKILREEPGKALEVPGITGKICAAISDYFRDNPEVNPAAYAALVDLFADQRFPRKLIKSLLKDWGSSAPDVVRTNPYLLLAYPRMGWAGVDGFATTKAGYDPNGIERQESAILESLQRISDDGGHTYATRAEIESACHALIGFAPEPRAWIALLRRAEIVSHVMEDLGLNPYAEADVEYSPDDMTDIWNSAYFDDVATFALPKLDEAERSIAYHLQRIAAHARPLAWPVAKDGLSEGQARAVRMIEKCGLCILAGSPGTGKSWVEAHVIAELAGHSPSLRVMCPTGKAAKRADELVRAALERRKEKTGHSDDGDGICHYCGEVLFNFDKPCSANRGTFFDVPCTTIHRALGPVPAETPEGVPSDSAKVGRGREGVGFKHHQGNPLEASLVFIDEFSMVDTTLAASVLGAIRNGCRVVIVGDPNQLPSVQAGAVLRDLMGSGIPVVELTDILRSDGGGTVVRACHAVKDGRVPAAARTVNLPTENWVHLEMEDPEEIARTIIELHESARANGRFDPMWDMQVISPQKGKSPIACGSLNQRLAELLNPPPDGLKVGDIYESESLISFRVGDKVIRKKNGTCDHMKPASRGDHKDWFWNGEAYALAETDVVNGDMGTVLDIVTGDAVYVVVRFRNPDRLCRLVYSSCELQPAYAITCHSAQGSGFPYVIMPVHLLFHWNPRTRSGLFCRELFYTGLSRAEQLLVTVGPWAAVQAVVGRQTLHLRRTKLVERVKSFVVPVGAIRAEEAVLNV